MSQVNLTDLPKEILQNILKYLDPKHDWIRVFISAQFLNQAMKLLVKTRLNRYGKTITDELVKREVPYNSMKSEPFVEDMSDEEKKLLFANKEVVEFFIRKPRLIVTEIEHYHLPNGNLRDKLILFVKCFVLFYSNEDLKLADIEFLKKNRNIVKYLRDVPTMESVRNKDYLAKHFLSQKEIDAIYWNKVTIFNKIFEKIFGMTFKEVFEIKKPWYC